MDGQPLRAAGDRFQQRNRVHPPQFEDHAKPFGNQRLVDGLADPREGFGRLGPARKVSKQAPQLANEIPAEAPGEIAGKVAEDGDDPRGQDLGVRP
ncbi:hypothetical protein ACQPZJ_40430 [Actinoplanes sp. CA-054009]